MKLFSVILGYTKIKEVNLKRKYSMTLTLLSLFYTEDKSVSMVIEILADFTITVIYGIFLVKYHY